MFSLNRTRRMGFYFFPVTWIPPCPGKPPKRKAHMKVLGVIPPMMGIIDKSNPQIPSDVHASLNRSQNPYIWGNHREFLVNLQ